VAQLDADACSVRIQAKELHEAEPYVFIELRLPHADRTAWRYHKEKKRLRILQFRAGEFDLAHRLLRPNDCFHGPQRRNLGWENIEKKTIEDSPQVLGLPSEPTRKEYLGCDMLALKFTIRGDSPRTKGFSWPFELQLRLRS
jgi:hypothetical protein